MPATTCPYCGHTTKDPNATRCEDCNGLFEPLSRKATQLAMGPWFVRDEDRPFMPGFSVAILKQQVAAGRIKADTIVRGPTTNQFWVRADQAPGLSTLLGKCHACSGAVAKDAVSCIACQADLTLPDDVDALGLAYVDPAARATALEEINAQRTVAPSPAPAPAPKPAPAPAAAPTPKPTAQDDGTVVDPDMMRQVETVPAATSEQAHDEPAHASHEASGAYDSHEEDYDHDIAEDIWHAEPTGPPRRRRRRKSGPDPLVMAMGVLLLCVVAGGVFLLIIDSSGKKGNDDGLAAAQGDDESPSTVTRDEEDVAEVSAPTVAAFQTLNQQGVPEQFEDELAAIAQRIQQADLQQRSGDHDQAYESYQTAQAMLQALPQQIAAWEGELEMRTELNDLRNQVEQLSRDAQAAGAEQYAPDAWAEAQNSLQNAVALIGQEQFAEAEVPLDEAQALYQMALGQADAGRVAAEARQQVLDAMSSTYPEQSLREHASALLDEFNAARATGDDHFNSGRYGAAAATFNEAVDILLQASQAVEFVRYRKFYAFDAGYRAAGMLMAVASGDGIESQARTELVEAYTLLALPNNPAAGVQPGADADYSDTAQALVHTAREAVLQAHGQEMQTCYQAGFEAFIIGQSLNTEAMSRDQQRRIAQSLNLFEELGTQAAWDIGRLRPAIEAVRTANRNANLEADPEDTRNQWERFIQPLRDRNAGSRLMDPTAFPSNGDPADPDFFGSVDS